MEDVEMSQAPPLGALRSQALQHLKRATELSGEEQTKGRQHHATLALRLADGDGEIQARANLLLAGCYEKQDKWCSAYYAYQAARDQSGGAGAWTPDMEKWLQYCKCKVLPR